MDKFIGSLEEKNEKMDDKQISDETVSSSNNQLGELETHCKSKQNENIWDKFQMTGQFKDDLEITTRGDNLMDGFIPNVFILLRFTVCF
jgi:hypothetical protein